MAVPPVGLGALLFFPQNGLVGQGGAKTLLSQHPASHAGQIPSQLYLIVDYGMFLFIQGGALKQKHLSGISLGENILICLLLIQGMYSILFSWFHYQAVCV